MIYRILNFLVCLCKLAFITLVAFGVCVLLIAFASKTEDIMNKRECYEIYATDDVILKKCEKYFDKLKDSDVK